MYFCLSRFLKKRKMYVQADKSWLPAFHFTTNFVYWQTYIMSRSSFVHFWHKQLFSVQFEFSIFTPKHFSFIQILFFVFFLFTNLPLFFIRIVFWTKVRLHVKCCFFECRLFVSIPPISNFQDKVKVARLDLFFLCVFPAFYVGFLLAYWIHFINRFLFLSIFKRAPENYENTETFLYCLQDLCILKVMKT